MIRSKLKFCLFLMIASLFVTISIVILADNPEHLHLTVPSEKKVDEQFTVTVVAHYEDHTEAGSWEGTVNLTQQGGTAYSAGNETNPVVGVEGVPTEQTDSNPNASTLVFNVTGHTAETITKFVGNGTGSGPHGNVTGESTSVNIVPQYVSICLDTDNDFATDHADDIGNYKPEGKPSSPQSTKLYAVLQHNSTYAWNNRVKVGTYSGNLLKAHFSFTERSSYKGYCMNAGSETTPDFSFPDNATTAVLNFTSDGLAGPVTLQSKDYGGKCKVKVEVKRGTTSYCSYTKTIPKDNNNNKIADCWENDAANNWTTDNETGPGNNSNNGDRLSPYEEYRGFMLYSGSHTRTSPSTKTLFIYTETDISFNGDNEAGQEGKTDLSYASAAALRGTEVYKVDKHSSRKINPNEVSGTGHQDQYHLYVIKSGYESGYFGMSDPYKGPPRSVDYCRIFEVSIQNDCNEDGAPASVFWRLARDVITHEIGHGVNLFEESSHPQHYNECYMYNFIHQNVCDIPDHTYFHTHHDYSYDHN